MSVRIVRNNTKPNDSNACCASESERMGIQIPIVSDASVSDGEEHSEAWHQMKVIEWCRQQAYLSGAPTGTIFHIPNGGWRSKREAATLKAMGVVAGMPDLFLPVPVVRLGNGSHGVALRDMSGQIIARVIAGLWIELKATTGKPSKEQLKVIDQLLAVGYMAVICYSADEAISVIKEYINT